MEKFDTEMPWVIFYLKNERFALSANYVNEMVVMPRVVPVVQSADYIRGVINLRGEVISVMDLRIKMGMPSLTKETGDIIKLLIDKEEDHKNWIRELESSVLERREFKLTSDPHQCAFGKWYDNYKTNILSLEYWLFKFDDPHKKIHAVAREVKNLERMGDYNAALDIVKKTEKTELAEMLRIFSESRQVLMDTNREIAMVLEINENRMAISVDSVASVEMLSQSEIHDTAGISFLMMNNCIYGIGKRSKNDETVLIIDAEKLFE